MPERIRGGPPLQSAALALLRASAEVAEAALKQVDEYGFCQVTQKAKKALHRLETVLKRAKQ